MSFFHSGPLGRVATEPKTSESEGVRRLCRQPVSECAGEEDDRPSGTDETAMLTILRHLHNLVANNLQLHGHQCAASAGGSEKSPHAEALGEWEHSLPRRIEGAGVPQSMTCSTVLLNLARACLRAGPCAVATLGLSAGASFAAEGTKVGASDVIFLAQLITLMLVGRLLGEVMNRIGQPSVMGMLLGGIVLGPSVLGALWPDLQHAIFPSAPEQKAMLDGVAQFGILLLLLLTGMETDLKLVRTVGAAALSISVTGVAVPFICGFALGQFMPQALLPHPDHRLLTSLFLGTALSISSIKIVAAVVREMGFTRRNLGQVIVASAICEDSIGWVIIAITFSLADAGEIDLASVGKSVIGTAVFLIGSFTIGRRIVFYLIRWANDNFESDFPVITTILVIMGGMALTTHFIGVHTVLGAFISGVLIGESPILSKHIDEQLRGLILAFFMPVFFGIVFLATATT